MPDAPLAGLDVGDGDHVPVIGRQIRTDGMKLPRMNSAAFDEFAICGVDGDAVEFVIARICREQFARREVIVKGNRGFQLLLQTLHDAHMQTVAQIVGSELTSSIGGGLSGGILSSAPPTSIQFAGMRPFAASDAKFDGAVILIGQGGTA